MPDEEASDAQLLKDAGLRIKSSWFGRRAENLPTEPATSAHAEAVNVRAQSESDSGEPIDPTDFAETRDFGGIFGKWLRDANRLPSYQYDIDQRHNPLAYFVNSQGRDRRDHWHQIGNDHITGLAGNDGVVQVYLADRGGVFLNRYMPEADPPRTLVGYFDRFVSLLIRLIGRLREAYFRLRAQDKIIPRGATGKPPSVQEHLDIDSEFAYSGGYSYLNCKGETWATAFRYAPAGAEMRRVFGVGYFETETLHNGIRHTRRVYAPYGNDPVVLADVEIQNRSPDAVSLRCYEYWDVNLHQMRVQWLRSGVFGSNGDAVRAQINSRFQPQITPSPDGQTLRFQQERFAVPPVSPEEMAGFIDAHPPGVYLANLSGADTPAADFYVDKRAFFGGGSPYCPDAVRLNLDGKTDQPKPGDSMPYCLVLRHDLHLAPGETKQLRFAYGATLQPDQSLEALDAYARETNPLEQTIQSWKRQLVYFSTGNSPFLQWEATWHAYNLLASTLYSEFFETHYIPQGSAYLYLHGADGAPRDQALFALPMVYMRPDLARGLLILLMRLRGATTRAMPYAFVGNGVMDNALGLHTKPSDLDLFFLLAIAEYLSATGDIAFLWKSYPLTQPGTPPTRGVQLTVLQHIEAAFEHLDRLGLGAHKLLTIGSGDWDDSIVASHLIEPGFNREKTLKEGESIPNSQMALYVLPLVASLIKPIHPELADRMQTMADGLREALDSQWDKDKKWFYRAWLWDITGNDCIGDGKLSLQSQVWALISTLAADKGVEADLLATVSQGLDDDSPTGAMLEPKGQVWPAVSQLLTWGYRRSRPDLAWRSLNRHTFAIHAQVYPAVWFNIWTGPDGTNSAKMPNPGGTWASPVTPMTDMPGLNGNQHAMSLLGLLRVCGIEPSLRKEGGFGLDIDPKAPPERFVLHTTLLHLDAAPGRIAGEYVAQNDGMITLRVSVPANAAGVVARLNGADLPVSPVHGRVDLPLTFTTGQHILFEVTWA